jgi:CMP-N-acetylneuraminic acid synthetase
MSSNMVEEAVLTAREAFPHEHIVVATDYLPHVLLPNILRTPWMQNVTVLDRPPEMCQDDTTSEQAVRWVLTQYPDEDSFVLMQATSPCLKASTLVTAHATFQLNRFAALVSVSPAYQPNGCFYFCTTEAFRRYGSWWNLATSLYRMSWEESIDVNYPYELSIASAVIWNRVHGGGDL